MATALATTRYRRLYESVILKALGSTRGMIARAFAAEYALLGAAAGGIGVGLAAALSWGVLYFFLDVPWLFQPGVLLGGLTWTVMLAVVVGVRVQPVLEGVDRGDPGQRLGDSLQLRPLGAGHVLRLVELVEEGQRQQLHAHRGHLGELDG